MSKALECSRCIRNTHLLISWMKSYKTLMMSFLNLHCKMGLCSQWNYIMYIQRLGSGCFRPNKQMYFQLLRVFNSLKSWTAKLRNSLVFKKKKKDSHQNYI